MLNTPRCGAQRLASSSQNTVPRGFGTLVAHITKKRANPEGLARDLTLLLTLSYAYRDGGI